MKNYEGFESRNAVLKECVKLKLSERQIIINLCKEINQIHHLRDYKQCDECRSERNHKRLLNAIFEVSQ